MGDHATEALVFRRGETRTLPHTLSETHHLSLTLIEFSPTAGTAEFELRNPEATPDRMVGGLIDQNAWEAESANQLRDRLHLPEKPVPIDTETQPDELFRCRLREKLEIGDRMWTVTAIDAEGVTLTPGHDYETPSLVNTLADAEYGRTAIAAAEGLNALDEGL